MFTMTKQNVNSQVLKLLIKLREELKVSAKMIEIQTGMKESRIKNLKSGQSNNGNEMELKALKKLTDLVQGNSENYREKFYEVLEENNKLLKEIIELQKKLN